jgi:ankyrin repeat protein
MSSFESLLMKANAVGVLALPCLLGLLVLYCFAALFVLAESLLFERWFSSGHISLCNACKKGQLEVADALLRAGADVEEKANFAITWALRFGHVDLARHLIENHGARLDARDSLSFTALHPDALGSVEAIEFLLGKGVSLADLWANGRSVFHASAAAGNVTVAAYLIEQHGFSVHVLDADGNTALHIAALGNFPEMITFLVGRGALVEAVSMRGKTPLWHACSMGHREAAMRLIELGADVNLHGYDGLTSLMAAVTSKNLELVRDLVVGFAARHDPVDASGRTALHLAAQTSLPVLKFLIQQEALIRKRTTLGRTVLHVAVRAGMEDVVDFLLKGVYFSIFDQSTTGSTPLHLAAKRTDPGMLSHLLQLVSVPVRTELVNATDNLGLSPLHWAWNTVSCTRVLLDAGAPINAVCLSGSTPLIRAASRGGFDVVKELLFLGADYHMLNANGRSALDLALTKNKAEIARFLKAWPTMRLLCALRSVSAVPRIAENAPDLRLLPEAHFRILKRFLGD